MKTDKFTLFVYCNFHGKLSTTVCSQNINKQNVNISDETLIDYSFLSRYHYTKPKNFLKRRYRICHWLPMFIGTPWISGDQNGVERKWRRLGDKVRGTDTVLRGPEVIFAWLMVPLHPLPWVGRGRYWFLEPQRLADVNQTND